MAMEQLNVMMQRLERIELALAVLIETKTVKEWYTTSEAAKSLGRTEYTVRE